MKAKKRGRSNEDWVPVLTVRDRAKNTYEAILPSVTTAALHQELTGKFHIQNVDAYHSKLKAWIGGSKACHNVPR